MQDDGDVPNFGAVEPPIGCELEPSLRVCDASDLTFETGGTFFLRTFFDSAKEVLERLTHSVRNVLEDLGKHFRMLAPQMLVEPKPAYTLPRVLIGADVQLKKLIIRFLAGIECLIESVLLNPARIQPILIHPQFHTNPYNKGGYICA
jgi:hypothetical protein